MKLLIISCLLIASTLAQTDYDVFDGNTCGDGYEPLATNWRDCQNAVKSKAIKKKLCPGVSAQCTAIETHKAELVDHATYTQVEPAADRPQGCFKDGATHKFHFNAATSGFGNQAGDKIICRKQRKVCHGLAQTACTSPDCGWVNGFCFDRKMADSDLVMSSISEVAWLSWMASKAYGAVHNYMGTTLEHPDAGLNYWDQFKKEGINTGFTIQGGLTADAPTGKNEQLTAKVL